MCSSFGFEIVCLNLADAEAVVPGLRPCKSDEWMICCAGLVWSSRINSVNLKKGSMTTISNLEHALAISGGAPVRTDAFPPWPEFEEEEIQAAAAVLRSGRVNYWTGGEGRASSASSPISWDASTRLRWRTVRSHWN